ncbi:MAG TPA: endolytic transglycosylase MltG [Solirubrobacteraceae bacterium]|nr:endolytic transglycosylase MltG [Solirubrobacteraceae bacterium]
MTDFERSAAEREAARIERERRRAARTAGGWTDPPPAPEPEEVSEQEEPEPYQQDAERPLGTRRATHAERMSRRSPAPTATRAPRPDRPRQGHAWVGRIIIVLALAAVIAVLWFVNSLFQPLGTSPHGHVTVVVPHNAGARQIGDLLAKDGVVPSGFFFNLRATLAGDRGKLYAGTYHLELGMSYGRVLTILSTPPPTIKTSELTLIEGLTRAKIDKLLRSQHIGTGYLAATRHSPLLNPVAYGAPRSTPSLEGFLFPDTYQLRDPITVPELVRAQLETFKLEFAKVNLSYARAHRLTPYDVLIIASLVQGEAQTAHDFPLVASVIYNRLRLGMLLQIDATTRYAVGNYTKPLTESQLHSNSPWNTRVHAGLPPTPIDNPGLAAIQAAAHPARSNYIYYVTKVCGHGALAFASSGAQFDALVAAYYAKRTQLHGRSPTNC